MMQKNTICDPYLTAGFSDRELLRQIGLTVPGMAHFATTGPLGCVCKDCVFYGYQQVVRTKSGDVAKTTFRPSCCGKFHSLTGKHGEKIPPQTEACRHFVERPKDQD
jgi:hypothetical protein